MNKTRHPIRLHLWFAVAVVLGCIGNPRATWAEDPFIFCPLKFRNLVQEHLSDDTLLVLADGNLYTMRDVPNFKYAFRRLRQDVVALYEGGEDFERTIEPVLFAVTNANVTASDTAKALAKAEALRGGFGQAADDRWLGVLMANPTPYSTSWLMTIAAGNRGHLFEAAAAYNSITEGIRFLPGYGSGVLLVERSEVLGMGFTTLTAAGERIQGDLVSRIPSGVRYIDFKSAYPPGVEYDLDQLRRVAAALQDGSIQQAIFAIEAGSVPDPIWLAQLSAYNAGLPPTRKILVGTVGTF